MSEKCSPKTVTIQKIDTSQTVTPLDTINKDLQMLSGRATMDACNDTQVKQESPNEPTPPSDPNVRYLNLTEGYTATDKNIDQTIQFLIVVFFGVGAYALFKGLK